MSGNKRQPEVIKFLFGGLAGTASSVIVHPFDVLKNRMQIAGRGTTQKVSVVVTAQALLSKEGPTGFYAGLTASMLRQMTYSTMRFGVYNSLLEKFSKGGQTPSFAWKMAYGSIAGAMGALVGTPAEVALVRMAVDGTLPAAERRNYKGVVDALFRVVREEGVLTLWRGVNPTVARAVVLNATQLSFYSQAKEMLAHHAGMKDGIGLHTAASLISGFGCAVASLPVDILKTRIQNQKYVNGVPEYTGMTDVFVNIVRKEGVVSLWKGFFPYFTRLGPHTIFSFVFLEQLNGLWNKYS
eukprot:m.222816 g.222816  ORF g.222816 m.222816 type:complete len:297 (+) comp54183_c0_seq2:254-1144(+)